MNRSLGYVGVGVILGGIALVAFPIVVTGAETFDVEQAAGLLIAPVGLVVVMFAAAAHDPRQTTVAGAFGNPDEPVPQASKDRPPDDRHRTFNPNEAVSCRQCRTFIAPDLAQCPRCARARECRPCGRPLGFLLDRPTCPRCARAEPFCSCPLLPGEGEPAGARVHPSGW